MRCDTSAAPTNKKGPDSAGPVRPFESMRGSRDARFPPCGDTTLRLQLKDRWCTAPQQAADGCAGSCQPTSVCSPGRNEPTHLQGSGVDMPSSVRLVPLAVAILGAVLHGSPLVAQTADLDEVKRVIRAETETYYQRDTTGWKRT